MKLLIISILVIAACSSGDAPAAAHAWADRNIIGAERVIVDCVDKDTDTDGYVGCTVTASFGNGQPPTMYALRCATGSFWNGCGNSGCQGTRQ